MTEKEKKARAKARKELRKDGVLPPKKKPLNREKFTKQAKEALRNMSPIECELALRWALSEMLARYDQMPKYTLSKEAVGAAKVILLAEKRIAFEREVKEQGRDTFSIGELYEAVKDIYNA